MIEVLAISLIAICVIITLLILLDEFGAFRADGAEKVEMRLFWFFVWLAVLDMLIMLAFAIFK